MKDNSIYSAQIRMSEELHQHIMRIANSTGETINGTMLHLLALGVKVYDSPIVIHSCSDSSGNSTGPCSAS